MLKVKDYSRSLSSSSRDENQANVLNKLSSEFLNSSLERANDYAKEALELSMEINYPHGLAEAYANLGRTYCRASKNDKSKEYFNQAIEVCKKNSLSILLGRTYGDISNLYRIIGDIEASLDYALKGLDLLPPDQDTEGYRAYNLNCMGNVYQQLGKVEEAYKCYEEGIEILTKVGNNRIAVNMRGNLAVLLSNQEKHKESLEQFKVCLEEFKKISNRQGESITLVNIGYEYYNMGVYPKALNHFLKGIRLLKVVNNKRSLVNAYRGLGLVYVAFTGYDEALKHLLKSLEIAQGMDYPYGIYLAQLVLGETYAKKEEIATAKEYFTQAWELSQEKKWGYDRAKHALEGLENGLFEPAS